MPFAGFRHATDLASWKCVQVANYTITLVCLRVQTLEQCVAMIEPALSKGMPSYVAKLNVRSIKHTLLAMLRQWLYARAVRSDVPLPDTCPALDAEACFDAGCPIAARVGLKAKSSPAVRLSDAAFLSCLAAIMMCVYVLQPGQHSPQTIDPNVWLWHGQNC